MGQTCSRREASVQSRDKIRDAALRAAEMRAAATAARSGGGLNSTVPSGSANAKSVGSSVSPQASNVLGPSVLHARGDTSGEIGENVSSRGSSIVASKTTTCPPSFSTTGSRTKALAVSAKVAAGNAAASRAEALATARRAEEEFQRALSDGSLSSDTLRRLAVGETQCRTRCYVNHDEFSQDFWDMGHPMDSGEFTHSFGFWAFTVRRPGTHRIVIGIAGGHVGGHAGGNEHIGPLRCLVNCSGDGEAGCYTPEMAQYGFTPYLSFWAWEAAQPGTIHVAIYVSISSPVRSLLVRIPQAGLEPQCATAGFRMVADFWAYPDPGPLSSKPVNLKALRFQKHQGYISAGGDLAIERMTVERAKMRCAELPGCRGFTFTGMGTDGTAQIFFKNKWNCFSSTEFVSYRCFKPGEINANEEGDNPIDKQHLPEEYRAAERTICISKELLGKCGVLENAEVLKEYWPVEHKLFEELVAVAGRRAFPECGHQGVLYVHLLHDDDAPRVDLLRQLCKLNSHESRDRLCAWRIELLPSLLRFLAEAADPSDASAALLLLAYSSWRLFDSAICPMMARRCFDRCLLCLQLNPHSHVANSVDARAAFREWVAGYLETYKGHALASAFLEPTKLYWRRLHRGDEINVDSHAANVYAGLVEKVLGVRCPMPVSWDDAESMMGIVEFLRAPFLQGALQAMERLENFGVSYTNLVRSRGEADGQAAAVPLASVRFIFAGAKIPEEIVARALWLGDSSRSERAALTPYLERFARFFREDFFLEAVCNAALVDSVRGGARRLADALRLLIVEDAGFLESARDKIGDSITSHAGDTEFCRALLWTFDENLFPTFNVDSARKLFEFTGGILKDRID